MAADDRFETALADALHRYLGAAAGPDARWSDAPISTAVAVTEPPQTRRPTLGRSTLLIAAALALIALMTALVVGGQLQRQEPPKPPNGLIIGPSIDLATASPSPSPAISPTPSNAKTSPAPSVAVPVSTCLTSWSHAGSLVPPGPELTVAQWWRKFGLADGIRTVVFEAPEGGFWMVFGHSIETVRGISIAPTEPPFTTGTGHDVKVRGTAFLKVTLRGLTRSTYPEDLVRGHITHGPGGPSIDPPVVEMRKIRGGTTETWIVGLDHPVCLTVTTSHETGYGSDDPGANSVFIHLDPRPSPSPPG